MALILLAEDDDSMRSFLAKALERAGHRVRAVADGIDALAALAEEDDIDLLLADVVMPEPTGYEICRRIKASDRPVPVLLLAGTFEAFDHDEARECGADGCLLKPFEGRTLERDTSSGLKAGVELRPGIVATIRFEGIVRDDRGKLTLRDPKILRVRTGEKDLSELDRTKAIEELFLKQRLR